METEVAAPTRLKGPLVSWSIGLTLIAGGIHVVATEEHFAEWWGYGVFFVFASLAQLFYGILLGLQPWRNASPAGPPRDPEGNTRRFLWAGVVGNAAIILLYVVTRTAGVPFAGPAAGEREPATPLGIASKVAELGLIACLLILLRRHAARPAEATSTVAGPVAP